MPRVLKRSSVSLQNAALEMAAGLAGGPEVAKHDGVDRFRREVSMKARPFLLLGGLLILSSAAFVFAGCGGTEGGSNTLTGTWDTSNWDAANWGP